MKKSYEGLGKELDDIMRRVSWNNRWAGIRDKIWRTRAGKKIKRSEVKNDRYIAENQSQKGEARAKVMKEIVK